MLLPDPVVVSVAGRRITLTHGDAQCTDDTAYMAFRAMIRQPGWQQEFLAMPLAQRKAIIADLRTSSREAQQTKSYDIMDVNAEAIASLFESTGTSIVIHGHTHRPARHDHAGSCVRYVLSDWNCDSDTPRGGWLAMDTAGAIKRYGVDGTEL
jgi:UDP-2,3-diacylglucosamine hydrolase